MLRTNTPTIRHTLTSKLGVLSDNIKIIENSDQFDISNLDNGILTLYASWSGQAQSNCLKAIQTLNDRNYIGQILIIDIDYLTPEFQNKMLGQVSSGWGEIFIVSNGKIIKEYLGKDSFENFNIDIGNHS